LALELSSEQQRSNALLEQSIAAYEVVLKLNNIPPALLVKAARKCASRMAFRGSFVLWSVILCVSIGQFEFSHDMIGWFELLTSVSLCTGWSHKAAQTLEAVAYKHPGQVVLWNEAGVQWLMTNQNEKARYDFQQVGSLVLMYRTDQ
jgi:hypothetical protein